MEVKKSDIYTRPRIQKNFFPRLFEKIKTEGSMSVVFNREIEQGETVDALYDYIKSFENSLRSAATRNKIYVSISKFGNGDRVELKISLRETLDF